LCSAWRLVHNENTPFGPVLWLSVAVDAQTPPPQTTPPDNTPQTNEELLQRIGFLPSSGEVPAPTPDEDESFHSEFIIAVHM